MAGEPAAGKHGQIKPVYRAARTRQMARQDRPNRPADLGEARCSRSPADGKSTAGPTQPCPHKSMFLLAISQDAAGVLTRLYDRIVYNTHVLLIGRRSPEALAPSLYG